MALLLGDVSIGEVNLVGKEGDNNAVTALVLDIVHPLLYALEGVAVGDIIDDNGHRGIANVVGDEGLESLLASGVPELEADGLLLEEDVLGDEIDADGGSLDQSRGTCSFPSKMS